MTVEVKGPTQQFGNLVLVTSTGNLRDLPSLLIPSNNRSWHIVDCH